MRRAALAGSDAAHDGGPVSLRLLRVKRAFTAGDALDDQTSRLINEYGHISPNAYNDLLATAAQSHRENRYPQN